MQRWLATARTIAATAAVTSAAWLIGGAIWVQHERARWVAEASGPRPVTGFADAGGQPTRQSLLGSSARTSLTPGRLAIPVAGVGKSALVDTFTQARAGGERIHDAIDILAPQGTPVLAAAPGTVEKLFVSEDGGNTVYVRSPDRTTIYYYAHLDAYAPGLAERQQVRAGQRLGTVGATGNADPQAPHLHFAVMKADPQAKWWDGSAPVNPYPLLTGR